jgi:hypothetical protein
VREPKKIIKKNKTYDVVRRRGDSANSSPYFASLIFIKTRSLLVEAVKKRAILFESRGRAAKRLRGKAERREK